MKRNQSAGVILLPLLSNAAALHAVLVLFAFRNVPIADHTGMLIWWGGLGVCYAALRIFLQKPRELRSVILLCALILAGQLAISVVVNPVYPNLIAWFACVCMWVFGYYKCAMGVLNGVKPEELTVNFETTSASLFVVAVVSAADAMPIGTVLHLAIGVLCILVALMRIRTLHTRMDDSQKRPLIGWMVPLIVLGAAICAILFCVIIGGHAAQLLTRFTAWLGLVVQTVGHGIGAFIMWLFSLLPKVDDSAINDEAFAADALPSGMPEMDYESNGALLYILIALFVIALLVLVFMIWRKVRVQGSRTKRMVVRPVVVKKSGIWQVFLRMVTRLMKRVRFEVRYLQNYHSLPGLLVWLERRMARKGIKRKAGETTASYLMRIKETYPNSEDTPRELSVCLDRYYFGDGQTLTKDEVQSMRKILRKMEKK